MSDNDKNNDLEVKENIEVVETEEKDPKDEYERYCLVCHRPESVTGKLIEMPNNLLICQDCMQKSFDTLTNGNLDYNQLLNMPGVSVLNMHDLQQNIPKKQAVKKKKPKAEKDPELNIRDIPAPHKIKASLDEYVIGRRMQKKRCR